MLNPNAIVSAFIRLEPPLDRPAAELLQSEAGLSVELEGGQRVRLDPEDPRSPGFAQILDGLRKQRLPVYVEIDPATSAITRVLIPLVARVGALRAGEEEALLNVELVPSHARHVLDLRQPDGRDLEGLLREAAESRRPLIVTEDDAHRIIDVRPYVPSPEAPPPPFPEPRPRPHPGWAWKWIWGPLRRLWWWLWWWLSCPSATTAQQIFDAMAATTCDPLTVPAPCIPFLYPDDGCWARAHEMCRLMINMGRSPNKVWIEASTLLHVNTKNNPACYVEWGWHVAPTLCVRGSWFQTEQMVIDPSLFTTPVTKATWKGVQGDPGATLTDTDASIYYLWGNVTDPMYAETNYWLAYYRLQLQNRAVQQGPPPYANCP